MSAKQKQANGLVIFLSSLFFLTLDQGSKWAVMVRLGLAERCQPDTLCFATPFEVYPPFLRFVMSWNKGINFGFAGNQAEWFRYLLIGIALIICLYILIYAKKKTDWLLHIGAGMIIGGALGNVYDRIAYGAVADFLNMSCCGFNNPYVFNLADVFIFLGLGIFLFRGGKTEKS